MENSGYILSGRITNSDVVRIRLFFYYGGDKIIIRKEDALSDCGRKDRVFINFSFERRTICFYIDARAKGTHLLSQV